MITTMLANCKHIHTSTKHKQLELSQLQKKTKKKKRKILCAQRTQKFNQNRSLSSIGSSFFAIFEFMAWIVVQFLVRCWIEASTVGVHRFWRLPFLAQNSTLIRSLLIVALYSTNQYYRTKASNYTSGLNYQDIRKNSNTKCQIPTGNRVGGVTFRRKVRVKWSRMDGMYRKWRV